MLEQKLIELGLSDKEVAAYLSVLRHGTRATSFIAKRAGLNRGTAYVALHSLLQKGLVAKSVKKKIQYFTALPPEQLNVYLDRKQQELKAKRQQTSSLIDELLALSSTQHSRPRIEFYEGVDGAAAAMMGTLEAREKTLRAFLSIFDIIDFLGNDWLRNYTQQRIKLGYTLHVIRAAEKDRLALEHTESARQYMSSTKDRRDVRYIGDDLAFPLTMYVYDDKIMVLSSKEESFAAVIESQELSSMQKKLFLLIWNSLEPNQ